MKRYRWKTATGCVATLLIGANAAPAQTQKNLPKAPAGLGAPVIPIPVELPVMPNGEIRQVQEEPTIPVQPNNTTPIQQPSVPNTPVKAPEGSTTNIGVTPDAGGISTTGAQQPTQSLNASDLGSLLSKSDQATGVEVQRRNAISSEPRVRGFRNGQYLALGDGVPYFPGRLDLDTPVSKFYPAMVRDVQVVRGPYTTLLGPGFAFINIGTVNAPRAKDGCGTEYHGVSSLGYQTNGEQYNALQVVSAAGSNWGFRGSYNILQGNDYADGGGNKIPASYLSNNFNVALGYDLSDDITLDFKGLRSFQSNLEFPGLYFDVDASDSEAYSTRLTARNFGPFDVFTADLWYNASTTSGSTRGAAKQAFVNQLIRFAFEEPFLPRDASGRPIVRNANGTSNLRGFDFADRSTTRFAERSIGYRLAGQWGNLKDELTITTGTDLNVFGQGLTENILFAQLAGPMTIQPNDPVNVIQQSQSIPKSNSFNPGLFVEAMLPVGDTWKFKSGGRLDYVRTSSNARVISGNVDLFGDPQNPLPPGQNRFVLDPSIYSVDPSPISRFQGDVNPASRQLDRDFALLAAFATAEYKLTDATTLFLGYGYSERAPTLTELYATGPFVGVLQTGTSRLIGDPNLSKERLNQFDVGLRYDTDYLKFGISGYYSLINDYITYDANRLSNLGLSQVVYTNTDLATLAGTELYLQANVTKMFSPFATISYVQGIDQTHVDNRRGTQFTQFDANGNPIGTSRLNSSRRRDPATGTFATDTEPLPQISPMETRLGFRLHGAQDVPKWQLEVSARIVNGQNAIARSLGEQATPGFTTVDLRGFYQVSKNFLITAGVENLGDRLYREHLDPIAANLLRSGASGLANGVPVVFRPGTNFFFNTQLTY